MLKPGWIKDSEEGASHGTAAIGRGADDHCGRSIVGRFVNNAAIPMIRLHVTIANAAVGIEKLKVLWSVCSLSQPPEVLQVFLT